MTAVKARRAEAGFMALEAVIIAPAVMLILLLIIGGGRYVDARMEVTSAAAEAARAASLESDPSTAQEAGRLAAIRTLENRGPSCADLDVEVDVSSFVPGGRVTATVRCSTDMDAVASTGLPGVTLSGKSSAPIEQYRAGVR